MPSLYIFKGTNVFTSQVSMTTIKFKMGDWLQESYSGHSWNSTNDKSTQVQLLLDSEAHVDVPSLKTTKASICFLLLLMNLCSPLLMIKVWGSDWWSQRCIDRLGFRRPASKERIGFDDWVSRLLRLEPRLEGRAHGVRIPGSREKLQQRIGVNLSGLGLGSFFNGAQDTKETEVLRLKY